MSEVAKSYQIEDVPVAYYRTGFGPDIDVEYNDQLHTIHRTGNLKVNLNTYLRYKGGLKPRNPKEFAFTDEYLMNYGIGEVFEKVESGYPNLFLRSVTLIQEEGLLRQRIAATQNDDNSDEAQNAWADWRDEHVNSHEQEVIMSKLFDALAPLIDAYGDTITKEKTGDLLEPADLCY